MLRVIVKQARPGMRLARSVMDPRQPEQALLAAGAELGSQTIVKLHEVGVYDLWVEYPGLEFLDEVFLPEIGDKQRRLSEALRLAAIEQRQLLAGTGVKIGHRKMVEDLARAVLANSAPRVIVGLGGEDDALLAHSCEVAVLAMTLGMRLENYVVEQRKQMACKDARDVLNLGIGCLLHDIGELHLPEEHRESRLSLAFEEDAGEEWKRHAELGYAAVRGQIEPSAATVVLNHHQHFDGTGFPRLSMQAGTAQSGSQIHVFSRLALAADTFVHMLHRDGIRQPTMYALWQIQQEPVRRWFDPVVLGALLELVPPFVPGMVVTLSDWRQGVVTQVRADSPCYPEVQVLADTDLLVPGNVETRGEVIDLAGGSMLSIVAVDGFEVGKYLFGNRGGTAMQTSVPNRMEVHAIGK